MFHTLGRWALDFGDCFTLLDSGPLILTHVFTFGQWALDVCECFTFVDMNVSHFWSLDHSFKVMIYTFAHWALAFDECFALFDIVHLFLTNVLNCGTSEPCFCQRF